MISKTLYSSRSEEWYTPQPFFDKLNEEFHFTLDPCATKENTKCAKFFTKEQDGLTKSWANEIVFMNPPYGRDIKYWMEKAYKESLGGAVVVCLIHARTDTRWFWDWVIDKAKEIRFIKGRIRFGGLPNSSPFPSLVVVYDKRK